MIYVDNIRSYYDVLVWLHPERQTVEAAALEADVPPPIIDKPPY